MKQITFWTALEYTCRLLGVSTGAVLIGVGTETLQQGQFKNLAIYLLFSGVAVLVCEAAYFVSLPLTACFILQVGSRMQACCKQMRRRGAFQKFLAYVLLSVACFLHPVLVWHVTVPGMMLMFTGLAYFWLSKQQKETPANGPMKHDSDPCSTVAMLDVGDNEQSFLRPTPKDQLVSFLRHLRRIFKGHKNLDGAMDSSDVLSPKRQVYFDETVVNIPLSVKENPENSGSPTEESTSDTVPILEP